MGRAERVAQPAEREQPEVGVGAVGEPRDEHRHEVALDGGTPAHAGGECGDVCECAARVVESDRREPSLGLLARELEFGGGKGGDRRQQRPVEESLVQPAHALSGALPHGLEFSGVAAESRRPGEHAQTALVARHQVRASQSIELHAMLEHAQDAVVARELGGLLTADVAAFGECREGGQRAGLVDRVVGRTVHELQQLHGELDVAKPSGSELDLHVDLVGGDVLGDPLAHALHRLDESLATRTRPDLGRHAGRVACAEFGIAGERPRLEQRLELPALRPPVVVLQVRLERAYEGAVLSLGAQVRVDLPQRRLDAGFGDERAWPSSRAASRCRVPAEC